MSQLRAMSTGSILTYRQVKTGYGVYFKPPRQRPTRDHRVLEPQETVGPEQHGPRGGCEAQGCHRSSKSRKPEAGIMLLQQEQLYNHDACEGEDRRRSQVSQEGTFQSCFGSTVD